MHSPAPQSSSGPTVVGVDHRAVPPALFVAADAFDTSTGQLMGRHAAGYGFLRAMAAAYGGVAPTATLVCPARDQAEFAARILGAAGWPARFSCLPVAQPELWAGFDVLHYPAPISDALGWQRARRGMASFALTGVTHTLSSEAVMRQLAAYVDGPFAPWDALVCTSRSVLVAVQSVWREQLEFLSWRMGMPARPPLLPLTPVIPLGVHARDFAPDPGRRALARSRWGFSNDEVVVLFVGRLSLHAKANPLPMYLACARAAARSGRPIRILECGWFAHDGIRAVFDEAAGLAGVRVDRVDGREAGMTALAYAGADIFVSLSDNIQETYGLTPVEAMAAGLPVVASDWNGYRDTLIDSVTALLVPSRQVADPAAAEPLIRAYEDGRLDYDRYIGRAHLLVSVDVEAAAVAIARLALAPALRAQLGAAGQARVRANLDWRVVARQYQALWDEQSLRLRAARADARALHPVLPPGMPNPLKMFSHYPSSGLDADTRVWRASAQGAGHPDAQSVLGLGMWNSARDRLPDVALLGRALAALPADPAAALPVSQLAAGLALGAADALRLVAWMHKVGLVEVGSAPSR